MTAVFAPDCRRRTSHIRNPIREYPGMEQRLKPFKFVHEQIRADICEAAVIWQQLGNATGCLRGNAPFVATPSCSENADGGRLAEVYRDAFEGSDGRIRGVAWYALAEARRSGERSADLETLTVAVLTERFGLQPHCESLRLIAATWLDSIVTEVERVERRRRIDALTHVYLQDNAREDACIVANGPAAAVAFLDHPEAGRRLAALFVLGLAGVDGVQYAAPNHTRYVACHGLLRVRGMPAMSLPIARAARRAPDQLQSLVRLLNYEDFGGVDWERDVDWTFVRSCRVSLGTGKGDILGQGNSLVP
jgi:hypothetical protein